MEQFIIDHYQFISTIFGLCAALYVGVRVLKDIVAVHASFVEWKQRHTFQAGYFDVQEKRYDRLLDKFIVQNENITKLQAQILVLKSKS